jgi:light-independent protochlorophyllide reductase subunit B
MQLTVWTYEGPPHVGAMRIATSMRDVHYVLHAPQGDTYADLLFTMIERHDRRPPVTYTTFQARDLGGDTANLVRTAVREAYERFRPQALLVGESCTAELIQDQPGSLAQGMGLPIPVVALELPSYSKKELWGASETLYQLVRALCLPLAPAPGAVRPARAAGVAPRCNVLGPTSLGFRDRDDVREVTALLQSLGVAINVVAPLGASPDDLRRLPDADFNVCLHPEIARSTCDWLRRTFGQPVVSTVPIGVGATRDFLAEVARVAGLAQPASAERPGESGRDSSASRLPWYSRSVDSTYLTGKRVFVFGDGTHACAAARIAVEEMGFTLVGLGTYSREMAREVRAAAAKYGVEALIADDYLEVERHIAAAVPELVLGTQMERHVAKRLGIPCAVISAPIHVQDVPARHSPQMGWEGANVIFDSWIHPLMMGLEEHLLQMFRGDFEFHDGAAPSHLAAHEPRAATAAIDEPTSVVAAPEWDAHELIAEVSIDEEDATAVGSALPLVATPPVESAATAWSSDAEAELRKIPFFVRGKARRNTERYAAERGLGTISLDTLYEAKAHYAR